MLLINKDDAKKIRKLNKQKGRSQDAGLICNLGKAFVQEYFRPTSYDYNIKNYIEELKGVNRKSKKYYDSSKKINEELKRVHKALTGDIKMLEGMIDIYSILWTNGEKDSDIKRFEEQLSERQYRFNQYTMLKDEFENLTK